MLAPTFFTSSRFPRAFKAIFCPRCGECVNEPDEILGAHSAEAVNCFWCKRRHSIDQVAVCRQFAHLSEEQLLQGAKAGLLRMRQRLAATIRPVFTKLAFNEEECDVLLTVLRGSIVGTEELVEISQAPDNQRVLQHHLSVLWSLHTAISEALTEIKRTQEPSDGLHEGVSPATGDG